MKNLKNFLFTLVLPFFVMGITTSANAQMCAYGDPSYGSSDCQIQRHGTNNDQAEVWRREQQQSNQAEAQRQWQIREDAVQTRIAQYRATPSYGVIAASEKTLGTRWAGGYKTLADSTREALNGGEGEKYRVLASFSNTCAAVSAPKNNDDINKIIVLTDRDGNTALNKVWAQCEARYGKGKCAMGNNDKAMCSGYDYGVFTK